LVLVQVEEDESTPQDDLDITNLMVKEMELEMMQLKDSCAIMFLTCNVISWRWIIVLYLSWMELLAYYLFN